MLMISRILSLLGVLYCRRTHVELVLRLHVQALSSHGSGQNWVLPSCGANRSFRGSVEDESSVGAVSKRAKYSLEAPSILGI